MQFWSFNPVPRCVSPRCSEPENPSPENVGPGISCDSEINGYEHVATSLYDNSNSSSDTMGVAFDSAATLQTCPICCEEKDDVMVLDHWQPSGDISEHKMCGACRSSVVRNECPFCKEIVVKEDMLNFIRIFVKSVSSQARTTGHAAHECSALLEMWQFFEMEYEGQPGVIQRVAKMIVEDDSFSRLLEQAATSRQSWVHEAAGIFFRFYGMYADGELKADEAHGRLLEQTVEQILRPLEQTPPQASFLPRTGTPLGALVTQALVAWLCAWRANVATRTLRNIVRRAGLAAVHCYEAHNRNPTLKKGARERIHLEYLTLSHVPIWGSEDEDVVWKAFFGQEGRQANRYGIHRFF